MSLNEAIVLLVKGLDSSIDFYNESHTFKANVFYV